MSFLVALGHARASRCVRLLRRLVAATVANEMPVTTALCDAAHRAWPGLAGLEAMRP